MVLDDNTNEVYDSNFSCSNVENKINDLYNEVYHSLVKATKELKKQITKLSC